MFFLFLLLALALALEVDGLLVMNSILISLICFLLPICEGASFVKAQIKAINATCKAADIA